jgi:hypothetical protein
MDGTKTTRVESKSFYIFLASASLLQIRCRLRFGRVLGVSGVLGAVQCLWQLLLCMLPNVIRACLCN